MVMPPCLIRIPGGRLPFVCVEGNVTCVDCSCIPTEQVTGNAGALSTDLPIAALAAGVTVPWRRNNGDLYHMIYSNYW